MDPQDLMEDIVRERQAAEGFRPCALCDTIRGVQNGTARDMLRDAAAGTLSERALVRILAKHETGVGRRTIARHRSEGHKP